MGAVNFSIDTRLVEHLLEALPLSIFVETGTFEGEAIVRARPLFNEIHSIELSDAYFAKAVERFGDDAAVRLYHGDSRRLIETLQPRLHDKSVLYWLDAHWCVADDTAGARSQCPLLDELRGIGSLNSTSVIVIDDARLFLATPPAPHEASDWPTFQSILTALRALSGDHSLMIVNDVIVFFPNSAEDVVAGYAHTYGIDWLAKMTRLDALEEERPSLMDALEERRQAIDQLTAAANDRLDAIGEITTALEATQTDLTEARKVIAELKRAADDRARVIAELSSALEQAQSALQESELKQADASAPEGTRRIADLPALEEALARAVEHGEPIGALEAQSLLDDVRTRLAGGERSLASEPTALFARPKNVGRRAKAKLRGWFGPRIGLLVHYPPKPLLVPASYSRERPPDPAPVISIVTPSFEQARFIERTLCSVLAQGYPALEYFVQDGGSTDGSLQVLQRYTSVLSGWTSEPDEGQADAINRAFERTSGEIMGWLNSDDLLLPGALSYVARYFTEHPEIDVVYGNRLMIDDADGQIGAWIVPRHDDRALTLADYIPQETLFWRRRIWEASGAFVDTGFAYAMDWDLLLRFREAGARMAHLPRFLGAFRVHDEQKTTAHQPVGLEEMRVLRERVHGRDVPLDEVLRALRPYFIRHRVIHGWQRVLDRMPLERALVSTQPEALATNLGRAGSLPTAELGEAKASPGVRR